VPRRASAGSAPDRAVRRLHQLGRRIPEAQRLAVLVNDLVGRARQRDAKRDAESGGTAEDGDAGQASIGQRGQGEARQTVSARERARKRHHGRYAPVARHAEDGSVLGVAAALCVPVEVAVRSEDEAPRRKRPVVGRRRKAVEYRHVAGLVAAKRRAGAGGAGVERRSVQVPVRSFDEISQGGVVGARETVDDGHVAREIRAKDRSAAGIAGPVGPEGNPVAAEPCGAVEVPVGRLHQRVWTLAVGAREIVKARELIRGRDPIDRAESGSASDESGAVEVSIGSRDEAGRQGGTVKRVLRKALDDDDTAGDEIERVDRPAAERPARPSRAVKATVGAQDDARRRRAVGPVERVQALEVVSAGSVRDETKDLPAAELAASARAVEIPVRRERQPLPGRAVRPRKLTVDLELLGQERTRAREQQRGGSRHPEEGGPELCFHGNGAQDHIPDIHA
jgi:hypothetical protein